MELFDAILEILGAAVNVAGATIIVAGTLTATARFLFAKRREGPSPLDKFRQDLVRAVLLGVEFLIAADVVRALVMPPEANSLFLSRAATLGRAFLDALSR
jgi:uncharacterized membrane protein